MTDQPYNVTLMRAIREQITSHPETHFQATWGRYTECGTTHCIAGWAAVLTGAKPLWDRPERAYRLLDGVWAHGAHWSVPAYARSALRLTQSESDRLFYEMDETRAIAYLDELIARGRAA
ncbi:hypothetical protein ACZ90_00470 [Streptomyces albus subsp. albus]|nr:hypothetical protein ACZ90_00470 [Streptomyces albus subsp. albus]